MNEYADLNEDIKKALEEKCETKMSAELLYKEIFNSDDDIENIELSQTYNLSLNIIKKIRCKSLSSNEIEQLLGVELGNTITCIALLMDRIEYLKNDNIVSDSQKDKIYTYAVDRIKEEL